MFEKIESISELIKPDKTAFRTVHHIGILFCFILIYFILLERRNTIANDVNKQNDNNKKKCLENNGSKNYKKIQKLTRKSEQVLPQWKIQLQDNSCSHFLCAESQRCQCANGWLFLKSEIFCSASQSLCSLPFEHSHKHCSCTLWPAGVAMVTAAITQPVWWKHWQKREFSFLPSFNSFFHYLFFLLPVHVMLYKNPDLLLTWGFFMWMREWKQKVSMTSKCSPSPQSNLATPLKWAHSAFCWSRWSTAPSVYLKKKKHFDWMTRQIKFGCSV